MKTSVFIFLMILISIILCKKLECVNGEYFYETNSCICNQCYTGTVCSVRIPNCKLELYNQQCSMCRRYWDSVPQATTIIPAGFQTKYSQFGVNSGLGKLLTETIQKVHEKVGNADITDRHVVLGGGGTQLLHAFIYAFYKIQQKQLKVYARAPYYVYYNTYAKLNPTWSRFTQETNLNSSNVVEFIAQPNNPDGSFKEAHYKDSPYVVNDLVYYWPGNVQMHGKKSYNNMLFSLSKMTGHSSTRLGWALVKDIRVKEYMDEYIWLFTHGLSIDAQYRSYNVLKTILSDGGNFFNYLRPRLLYRSIKIKEIFKRYANNDFTILSPDGFVVVWLKCNFNHTSCRNYFNSLDIVTNCGTNYGATREYTRFNLQSKESSFKILIDRLEKGLKKSYLKY